MGEYRYECDSIDNGFNNAYAYSDRTIIITFRCIIIYVVVLCHQVVLFFSAILWPNIIVRMLSAGRWTAR